MGHYTAFGAAFVVKEKYRKAIKEVVDVSRQEPWPRWKEIADKLGDDELSHRIRRFLEEDQRFDWIAFANVDQAGTATWDNYNKIDEDGRWVFTCGLKNYAGTIERFVLEILPLLSEQVEALQVCPDSQAFSYSVYDLKVKDGKVEWDLFSTDVGQEYNTAEPREVFQ